MQLRIKNSSTWFSCKNCQKIFPVQNLLHLHEQKDHPKGGEEGTAGFSKKFKNSVSPAPPSPPPQIYQDEGWSFGSRLRQALTSTPSTVKINGVPPTPENGCTPLNLKICKSDSKTSIPDPSSSSSSTQNDDDPLEIDLCSSSSSSDTYTETSNDPCDIQLEPSVSPRGSKTVSLNGDEPKAEATANFLDHVTTRLAGKRRAFSCNYCGDDLANIAQVKEHIPLHIDSFNFPCNRSNCTKSFSSPYDQLRHQDRHLKKEQKKDKLTNQIQPPTQTQANQSDDPTLNPYLTRYCLCNQIEYGDMVHCDRKGCPKKWFHFPCVGLKTTPKGSWRCPPCKNRKRKRVN